MKKDLWKLSLPLMKSSTIINLVNFEVLSNMIASDQRFLMRFLLMKIKIVLKRWEVGVSALGILLINKSNNYRM